MGQVVAEINVEFKYGLGNALMIIQISDINNMLEGKPGAVDLFYEATPVEIPNLIEILLMDPGAIIEGVDTLFKAVNDLTLGRQGVVTTFPVPFIGGALARSLKAGRSDNVLENARRTVKATLDEILNTYRADDSNSTVVDLVAVVLTDLLGNDLEILTGNVTVQYYEHNGIESLISHGSYIEGLEIKSLMVSNYRLLYNHYFFSHHLALLYQK